MEQYKTDYEKYQEAKERVKEIKGFYKQFYFQRFTISFMLTKKAFDF